MAEPVDTARLRGLPRYNCDCLPAGQDGQPSDDADAIYCERWVVLAADLDAVLPALLAEVEALRRVLRNASDAMEWALNHLDRGDDVLEVSDASEYITAAKEKRSLVRRYLSHD